MSKTTIVRIAFLAIVAAVIVATTAYMEFGNVKEDISITPVVEVEVKDIVDQTDPEPTPIPEPEPIGAKSKTYMDYRAISNKNSEQWKLLQNLTICDDGMIRDSDGYIAAALGSAFGPIGTRYVFTLEGGKELLIIKADQKQDSHTCENNIFGLNNWDVIEFIIDSSKAPVWANGYVYGGNFNNCPEYAGDIVSWTKVEI